MPNLEAGLLDQVRDAATAAGLWEELETGWLCLDCELMPWSAKAQELLRTQYAAVGSAGRHALSATVDVLRQTAQRLPEAATLLADFEGRREMLDRYVASYRNYCWPVASLADLRLAPFHLLASEGAVHTDQPRSWHLSLSRRLGEAGDDVLMPTDHMVVDVTDEDSLAAGVRWWEALTERGGEGMVVKPADFTPGRGKRGLTQPAVKCRGREYLRIIYGPQYTRPEHLDRLRKRGLGRKRSLAVREFALGIEALERFVRREPLRRVHECAFAVLALESERVDPRLQKRAVARPRVHEPSGVQAGLYENAPSPPCLSADNSAPEKPTCPLAMPLNLAKTARLLGVPPTQPNRQPDAPKRYHSVTPAGKRRPLRVHASQPGAPPLSHNVTTRLTTHRTNHPHQ